MKLQLRCICENDLFSITTLKIETDYDDAILSFLQHIHNSQLIKIIKVYDIHCRNSLCDQVWNFVGWTGGGGEWKKGTWKGVKTENLVQ